ncbi:uncharacterized protein LOC128554599 [Mercenaria mercenaria]|uniref:uncharacterized protein LOC128554599 n=1 Tax=Mercenaria mercenaria TaxID=6596 RepID=UPI00234EEFE1|nr:uncharacterized protein LOC128554599 [Mercenaria mercenaria]
MDEHTSGTYSSAVSSRNSGLISRGIDRRFYMGSMVVPKLGPYTRMLGVVGPFIKGTNSKFFVTANHVMAQRWKYTDGDDKTRALQLIYGPDNNYEAHDCGRLVSGGRTGSLAALIQINQDILGKVEDSLKTGKFPFAGISPINFPSYDNRDSQKTTQVYVFGNQTRTATAKIIVKKKEGLIYLITIESILLKPNEGGAAIFIADQDNFLHCVGIYESNIRGDPRQCLVIPIEVILHNLGQELGQQLEIHRQHEKGTSFRTSQEQSAFQKLFINPFT